MGRCVGRCLGHNVGRVGRVACLGKRTKNTVHHPVNGRWEVVGRKVKPSCPTGRPIHNEKQ